MSRDMTKPTKLVCPAKTQISLGIRSVWSVFAARLMGSLGNKLSSCGQRRLWSDWADAQADLSLRWTHSHFVGFVMSRLIWNLMLFELYSIINLVNNKQFAAKKFKMCQKIGRKIGLFFVEFILTCREAADTICAFHAFETIISSRLHFLNHQYYFVIDDPMLDWHSCQTWYPIDIKFIIILYTKNKRTVYVYVRSVTTCPHPDEHSRT